MFIKTNPIKITDVFSAVLQAFRMWTHNVFLHDTYFHVLMLPVLICHFSCSISISFRDALDTIPRSICTSPCCTSPGSKPAMAHALNVKWVLPPLALCLGGFFLFLVSNQEFLQQPLAYYTSLHCTGPHCDSNCTDSAQTAREVTPGCPGPTTMRFFNCWHPVTALASFPGSGSSWIRYLLEQATGDYVWKKEFASTVS